ncbi:hypothetical protein [Carboxylicivirga mesophila]|nr:hypothetical protein [Carboxylicivirga mesophila]
MMNNITEETLEKFPLVKNNEAINLRVKASDEYKGTTLVHTIKGDSLSIMAYEWGPTSYNPLVEFLECGDSIFRKAYSDTLYLYKKKDGVVMEFQVQCFE